MLKDKCSSLEDCGLVKELNSKVAEAISGGGDLKGAKGKITFLEVRDDPGWGPPSDFIDANVIIQLDSVENGGFGFKLVEDDEPDRQAMFDLLRDAFINNSNVRIAYDIDSGKNNGILVRAAQAKS